MEELKNKPVVKQLAPINEAEGVVIINRRGAGLILHEGERVSIYPEKLKTACHGDTVVFSARPDKYGGYRGEVVKIISRRKEFFTGALTMLLQDPKQEKQLVVRPDDRKFGKPISVDENQVKEIGAVIGDKVYVEITQWLDMPKGTIKEILGKNGDHQTEMKSILRDRDLIAGFPAEVEDAAQALYDNYDPEMEAKTRRDFRKITTFTIDPHDAKDFDDAISYQKKDDGSYEVGVHIADVSHFVTPDSVLDTAAVERGTSIYLVDRVIPMLPETLSNDLASLKPDVDRLTMSAVFHFSDKHELLDTWFGKTIIHSDQRFTYEDAENILNGNDGPFMDEVRILNELAKYRISQREARGAIDVDTVEVRAQLDEYGKILGFKHKIRGQSNRLVEELMLLANEYVAKYIEEHTKIAGLYRVHDNPELNRIEDLREFLKKMGYQLKGTEGDELRKSMRHVMREASSEKGYEAIQITIIRSMAKAVYSIKNIGHFGLALKTYTHFTSPIRRYPDTIVHRILHALLEKHPEPYAVPVLSKFATTTSDQERNAQDAERASIKLKQMDYLEERKAEILVGTIMNINDYGLFVEEKSSACEGFLNVENFLPGAVFDSKLLRITHAASNQIWNIGDQIKIKIAAIDHDRKEVDFKLA